MAQSIRRGWVRRALLAAVGLLVIGGLGTGIWWVAVGAPRANERAAVDTAASFLEGWAARDWPAVTARSVPPTDRVVAAHTAMFDQLEVTDAAYVPTRITVERTTADVAFTAELELSGIGPLTYDGALAMVRVDGAWQVDWEPAVLHPAMVEGGSFARARAWPRRGQVRDLAGELLGGDMSSVVVGVQPGRITDPEEVVSALVQAAGADEAEVRALLAREDLDPTGFSAVIELDRPAFVAADPVLRPVPGILFRSTGEAAAPSVAPAVVGRSASATAEQAEELGPPYREGDVAGVFGVERARERVLAGSPALSAVIVDADGEVVEELLALEAEPGQDVQLTLDPRVQRAAEEALAGAPGPAALVAIDIPSGGLRAIANAPAGGFDRALAGRYPPGSTFKVITSAALLGAGIGPDDVLDCPGEQRVGGRSFRNAGQLALGPITHRQALARSCNTAYVGQAGLLGGGTLLEAARAFGFVEPVDSIAVPSFLASFPEPRDATELAAASIGQGRVEASPAHMASVAAAVAGGMWRSPLLVVGDPQEERPLPGDPAALAEMMRAVVTDGTGQAVAAVPGSPVAGKTGSAEFGTASPPQAHAWFIGFRDDVAFAVLVEAGGAGGAVAAPIAARFLELLG